MVNDNNDQAVPGLVWPDGGTTEDNHEATERSSEAITSPGKGQLSPSLVKIEIDEYLSVRYYCEDCGGRLQTVFLQNRHSH